MDSDSESELISLITQLISLEDTTDSDSDSELDSELITQIVSLVSSMDLDSQPKPESKLMSLVTQTISIDFDSQPKPLSELISLITQTMSPEEEDSDSEFTSLMHQSLQLEPEPELISLIYQIFSLVIAMNSKLISLSPQLRLHFDVEDGKFHVFEEISSSNNNNKWDCLPLKWTKFRLTRGEAEITHFLCRSCNGQNHEEYEKAPIEINHPLHQKHSLQLVLFDEERRSRECYCCDEDDLKPVFYYCSVCDYALNIACAEKQQELVLSMDSKSESKLISFITQLLSLEVEDTKNSDSDSETESKFIEKIIQIIHLVRSMDLDSLPKPESKLMSLVTQAITLFNSIDLDSQPKPLSQLISLIKQIISQLRSVDLDSQLRLVELDSLTTQTISLFNSMDLDSQPKPLSELISLIKPESDSEFMTLVSQTVSLKPEPELISVIYQILSSAKWDKLISLCPQVTVTFEQGKFQVEEQVKHSSNKWECLFGSSDEFSLTEEEEEDATHFLCQECYGKNHEKYDKTPVEIKHPLHPKHSLQLVLLKEDWKSRECYCCDEDLMNVFYYCSACDFALNIACAEKNPPVLSIDHPKWHEHTLAHFPRHAPITCDLCALPNSKSSPIFMCPPCDFVVHLSCLKLPRVIRISRHPHRISFTLSFDKGDWSCGVCRRKIDIDYGGYSCIKEGCSYVAHSKCATQSNVWDGEELEGEPEEEIEEEEVEPFVRISDGIIQHFSHGHHHLRLDENKGRDYNENTQCQVCITPIYFGNFYSCVECEFILHETCANFSVRIHHPIHPHLLTLVGINDSIVNYRQDTCAACPYYCTAGFFYECGKEGCRFKLHVQCATVSEPLVHESHTHPLFLTSKPEEKQRICSVCKGSRDSSTNETFNCIECDCDFALCFKCATIPQKVRYKHDKHLLTLFYGNETSTMMHWCEACERKINPKKRFYICDEYCCVTLHIECLIGEDLYMKPGSSWFITPRTKVDVLPNNHHMSRPICSCCKKRCPHKIAFRFNGLVVCSVACSWIFF